MKPGPRLVVPEMRGAARHSVDYTVSAEHRQLGELAVHLVNISHQGFMVRGGPDIARGERLVFRLPVIGRIEAHLVWSHDERAGFQFERLIRPDDFSQLVDTLQPNPRFRR